MLLVLGVGLRWYAGPHHFGWQTFDEQTEDASRFCFLEDVTSSMGYSGLACRFGIRVVAFVTFSTNHIYYPRTNFIYTY